MITGHEERFRRLYAEGSVPRLAALRRSAVVLRDQPRTGVDAIESMVREAHTLKGGAAVVGFGDVSRVALALEDVLRDLGDGPAVASPDLVDVLLSAVDAVEAVIDLAVDGQPHTADADAAVAALHARRS